MGSGALGKRDTTYESGSTWIGNGKPFTNYFSRKMVQCLLNMIDKGGAICLSRFPNNQKERSKDYDTCTPFGRAYYKKETNYFVLPYIMILFINIVSVVYSAVFWSISAVSAAQILRQAQAHKMHIFDLHWYRFAIIYGIISICFIVVLSSQGLFSMLWVIGTKWLIIGRRRPGQYDWDESNYCQRWQLHLTLSRIMIKGYGFTTVIGPLTGSAYIGWFYRAMGAKIGKNCCIWAGGRVGLMTEPDLVEVSPSPSTLYIMAY